MSLVLLKRKGKGQEEEQRQEGAKEQKSGFAGKVKAWFSGVKEKFVSAFEDFKESVSSAFNSIRESFGSAVSRVSGSLVSAVESVLQWFSLGPAMRAVSSLGVVLLVLGFLGLAVFGYMLYQNGLANAAQNLADGVGMIVSIMLLVVGATVAESSKGGGGAK